MKQLIRNRDILLLNKKKTFLRNQITDNITNKTKKAENVTDLGNLLEPFESHLSIRHIKEVMLSLIFNMLKYAMGSI